MELRSDEEPSIGSDFDSPVMYEVLLKILIAFPSVTCSTLRGSLWPEILLVKLHWISDKLCNFACRLDQQSTIT